jgi:hypothetical protein
VTNAGRVRPLLFFELLLRLGEHALLLRVHLGKTQIERLNGGRDDIRDDGARGPLVVRGDDTPGRPLRARRRQGVLVGLLISVPEAALVQIGNRELPVLLRIPQDFRITVPLRVRCRSKALMSS